MQERKYLVGGCVLASALTVGGLVYYSGQKSKKSRRKTALKKYVVTYDSHPQCIWASAEDLTGLYIAGHKQNLKEGSNLKIGSMLLKLGNERVAGVSRDDLLLKIRRLKPKDFPIALKFLEQPHLEANWTKSKEYSDAGKSYFGDKDWENALKQYDLAVELQPTLKYLYSNKALCLLKLSRFDEGLETCQKMLRLDYNFPKAHYLRGCIFEELAKAKTTEDELGEKFTLLKHARAEFRTKLSLPGGKDDLTEAKLKTLEELVTTTKEELQRIMKERAEKAEKLAREAQEKRKADYEARLKAAEEERKRKEAEARGEVYVPEKEKMELTEEQKNEQMKEKSELTEEKTEQAEEKPEQTESPVNEEEKCENMSLDEVSDSPSKGFVVVDARDAKPENENKEKNEEVVVVVETESKNVEKPAAQTELVLDEKVEEPVLEEKIEEPVLDQKIEEPVLDQKIEEPTLTEKIEKPVLDQKIEEPLFVEKADEPQEEAKLSPEPTKEEKVESVADNSDNAAPSTVAPVVEKLECKIQQKVEAKSEIASEKEKLKCESTVEIEDSKEENDEDDFVPQIQKKEASEPKISSEVENPL